MLLVPKDCLPSFTLWFILENGINDGDYDDYYIGVGQAKNRF